MKVRRQVERIVIDLEKFTITVQFINNYNELELFFDTPARRFYFSVIALVVKTMKEENQVRYVSIRRFTEELALLDEGLSGEEASKDDASRFEKVRKAWRYRLPNLSKGSLFKVLNRDTIRSHDRTGGDEYECSEDECDIWSSLIGYDDHPGRRWYYKFAIDSKLVSIGLNHVTLQFGQNRDLKAWQTFKDNLTFIKQRQITEELSRPEPDLVKGATIQFLADIENRFEHIMLLHPNDHQSMKSHYVPIHVTLEKKNPRQMERSVDYYGLDDQIEDGYDFKGFDKGSEPSQESWDEVRRKYNRIVVLADSGMGKTTLLRKEAWEVASQEKKALSESQKEVKDVSFPILLRLYDISRSDQPITETLLELIKREYPKSSTPIMKILQEKIEQGKCLILLDALDDVPIEQQTELSRRLNLFGRTYQGKIICTSRIFGYSGWFLDNSTEVEIVPFSLSQISEYVDICFQELCPPGSEASRMAEAFLSELKNTPQLRGLAQNPLLLSLLSRLYSQNKPMLPARRVDIYKEVLIYLLSEWKKLKKRESAFMIIPKIALLEEFAYHLNSHREDTISPEDLYTWIDTYLHKEELPTDFKRYTATELISELSDQDGIIVKLDRKGNEYALLHRTFQEFLAASYINKQMKKDLARGLEIAQSHFWNYEWHETLALLAGLMEDPVPLIDTILSKQDDIFSTLLLLAGSCLAETTVLETGSAKKVIDSIFDLWRQYPSTKQITATVAALSQSSIYLLEKLLDYSDERRYDGRYILPIMFALKRINTPHTISKMIELYEDDKVKQKHMIGLLLGETGTSDAANALIKNVRNKDLNVRNYAVYALCKLRTERVIEALIGILPGKPNAMLNLDSSSETYLEDAMCATQIVEVLFNYGSPESFEAALRAMNDPKSMTLIMKEVFQAAGRLGGKAPPEIIEGLLKELEGSDEQIKMYACDAIGNIRMREAIDPLSRILRNQRGQVELRRCAAKALGQIGDPRCEGELIKALKDRDKEIKTIVCESLSKIGTHASIDALIEAESKGDAETKSCVIGALKNIVPSQAMPVLRRAIKDVSPEIRKSAAYSLGEIGTDEAVDLLMKAANDPDSDVRASVVYAMGETGNPRVREVLHKAIEDDNDNVKIAGFAALGKVGASRVTSELVWALSRGTSMLRGFALLALCKCDAEDSADLLIQALKEGRVDSEDVLERIDSGLGLKLLRKIIGLPEEEFFSDNFFSMARTLAIRYRNHNVWFVPVYREVIQKARKENH